MSFAQSEPPQLDPSRHLHHSSDAALEPFPRRTPAERGGVSLARRKADLEIPSVRNPGALTPSPPAPDFPPTAPFKRALVKTAVFLFTLQGSFFRFSSEFCSSGFFCFCSVGEQTHPDPPRWGFSRSVCVCVRGVEPE